MVWCRGRGVVWGPSLTPSPPPNSVSLPLYPPPPPPPPLLTAPPRSVPVSPGRQLSIMCFSQNPSGTHCARRSPAEASAREAAESRRWRERCQSLSLIINFCHSAPVATTRSGSLSLPPPPPLAQSLSPHYLLCGPSPSHPHSVPLSRPLSVSLGPTLHPLSLAKSLSFPPSLSISTCLSQR